MDKLKHIKDEVLEEIKNDIKNNTNSPFSNVKTLIKTKKNILKEIVKECDTKSLQYATFYLKYKRIDDIIDGSNTILDAGVLVGLGISFSNPIMLAISTGVSAYTFITTRIQSAVNLKEKYHKYGVISTHYKELSREINTVLLHNNLSKDKVLDYISSCKERINIIESI